MCPPVARASVREVDKMRGRNRSLLDAVRSGSAAASDSVDASSLLLGLLKRWELAKLFDTNWPVWSRATSFLGRTNLRGINRTDHIDVAWDGMEAYMPVPAI